MSLDQALPPGFVPLTVGSGIRAAATRAPDKTAVICEGRRRNYAQLVEAMNRVANAVLGLGLRPGQNAALNNSKAALTSTMAFSYGRHCPRLMKKLSPILFTHRRPTFPK